MSHQLEPLTETEIAEVEQHKYFMSEKAGYDVGWECAEQDWRIQFQTADIAMQANAEIPPPKGLGAFFKRLISKAAV